MGSEQDQRIWGGTVDGGRFDVAVLPTENSHIAVLTTVHVESGEVLLSEEVPLTFGAIFGPDVADVAEWQAKSIDVIDGWYRDHGEVPPSPQGEQPG